MSRPEVTTEANFPESEEGQPETDDDADCEPEDARNERKKGKKRKAKTEDKKRKKRKADSGEQPPATSEIDAADLKFSRRPGTDGLHGMMYERKMAAFLFAKALHKTAEFRLASNVDGIGAFDDLVFRYRLKGSDVWKTCFLQLKHKENVGTILNVSNLLNMKGDFSLLKYFASYCQIKSNAPINQNLKHCGPFDDFEFVIYTNAKMEINTAVQAEDSDPLVILSSGTNCGQYKTFDEAVDTKVFKFFEEISEYRNLLLELDKLFVGGTIVHTEIDHKIESLKKSVTNTAIKGKLHSVKSNLAKPFVTRLIGELAECNFTLYKEFLSKVKIFHSQSNEKSLKGLIEKELDDICKSPSLAESIYSKFEDGFAKWWDKDGNLVWLSKNAQLWQDVVTHVITGISEPELRKFTACDIRFSEQQIQRLCDAIKHNTFLNIVTNSDIRYLQHLKTYQALNKLGYSNSLCIGLKSLMKLPKEIIKLWHSKWSAALVIDCDYEGNVADILLDILQQSVGCEQGLEISDANIVETLAAALQNYEQKVVLISTRQNIKLASHFQEELGNINGAYDGDCVLSDFDAESQRQILGKTVDFQGIDVTLDTLVGRDRLECIKPLVDSDVISILLSNEHKLCVGRQLSDLAKYYVPRVLQHHIYLKKDILKQTQNTVTFAVSGLQANELRKYLPVGETICEILYDEKESSYSFRIVSDVSTIGLSTAQGNNFREKELECFLSKSGQIIASTIIENFYNTLEQETKQDEVKYIILENKNPEIRFGDLKARLANVHWIHFGEGSFVWRDSNCNIDIIRRYNDEAKCRNYSIESVVEQSDRTILLAAEPGMGKSTFLSHMEHEIKKRKKSVWVLRINLNEHTQLLEDTEFEGECEEQSIEQYKKFLWKAAGAPEQCAAKLVERIFLHALEQTGEMVIILDGFDEISPDYTETVNRLVSAITNKTASQILVSSRFSYRQNLEDILLKPAFTLQPFSRENQIEFLEQYWNNSNETSKQENLRTFAEELLSLCLKNLSDKDGEFTCIPLQTMMLGEAFVKEATEYCSNGELKLPEKFDLLDLFNKFWEEKCDIYFSGKNTMDTSKPIVKREKELYFQYHMIAALISLFSLSEENGLFAAINARDLQQTNEFLETDMVQQFGMVKEMADGKPRFIHRCFAEYFAAKWLTDNFTKCTVFISDTLFKSTYEVTRNIFDRMLAKDFEVHGAVLNNDISNVEKILKNGTDINKTDKGGRTALHLAASCNSPAIQKLLSYPGISTNIPDKVLKWTPLTYADRTKSWMAMDILLQKGANLDHIVLNRPNSENQECEKEAMFECASKGYRVLMDFMFNCGNEINAVLEIPEHFQSKISLLHIASIYCQVDIIRLLVERGADVNIRDNENDTALHSAAFSGSVEIINILLEKGMCVNLRGQSERTPLHCSALGGNLETTKTLVEKGAALNDVSKNGYTPLLLAAEEGKLDVFLYLTERGADINMRNVHSDSALHSAANSGSVEIINILLDKGMCVNLTGQINWTPLHRSARRGNSEATKTLVERGAAINDVARDGSTPLLLAAEQGKLDVFHYLTERGADINIRNVNSNNALHSAAYSGSVEIINILLDKGMCVNLTGQYNWTPLHCSAIGGTFEATKTLVERGAALNCVTKDGSTPLDLAAEKGKLDVFHYLTEKGADINIRTVHSNTVLHTAAYSGSVEIINILLDRGMCVNVTGYNNWTPLHCSVRFGKLEATKTLVKRGAVLNVVEKYGGTPLFIAAEEGQLEIFHYLTERGADINIRNVYSKNALHSAAYSGSVEIINILLDRGMCVNVPGQNNWTPLHFSARRGNLEATKILVERGSALNDVSKNGGTALYLAAEEGKLEVFLYLTERGADINIRNDQGNNALHTAANSGSVEIINILLDKGMCVNLTGQYNWTPLHCSATGGNLEATKILVERGAALNDVTKDGSTPLLLAAEKGKCNVFHYLTERGADINIRNVHSNNALHSAANSGSVEIINILLDKGMCVNLTGHNNWTPLHHTAIGGNLEATKILVERGAALNNVDKCGNTPLLLAAKEGKLEVFHYLIERGADINIRNVHADNALHSAANSGSVEIINIFLDKGMCVNLTGQNNWTPLHHSARRGNFEATKTLVERGAALNDVDKDGYTPLLLAAKEGKLEVFHYLTERGADINIRNVHSDNALHSAANSGSVKIINILLDKGMCVNLTGQNNWTPLHLSAIGGNLEATKILVERGAALNDVDKDGYTPLLLAAKEGKLDVFHYLTERGADINIRNVYSNNALHSASNSDSVVFCGQCHESHGIL